MEMMTLPLFTMLSRKSRSLQYLVLQFCGSHFFCTPQSHWCFLTSHYTCKVTGILNIKKITDHKFTGVHMVQCVVHGLAAASHVSRTMHEDQTMSTPTNLVDALAHSRSGHGHV